MTFRLTAKQEQAQGICVSDATHIMLFGGSRSGKTFLLVRNIVTRALKASKSRHAIFRQRFNAVKASVWMDTFPKVMDIAYPGVKWEPNKTDFIARFPNGSEIWFAGLDDKERTEKVLGMEFATIYLNECSQISWDSRNLALTRLAQQVEQDAIAGGALLPRMYYDCNPPSKAHWTYRLFREHVDPESRQPLRNPASVASFQINPADNRENIAAGYLATLEAMSPRLRKRFLDGEFGDATPNALFDDATIDTWRADGELPEMVRIAVGVDPSGAGDDDNADADAIGIMVAGLGVDGNAYVLEDCTVKAGPAVWGSVVASAYDRHAADIVVGEVNYGGAMVQMVVQQARPRTPFKAVTASRGKHVRAEPFSALYANGKVRHAGRFVELEDELCAFSTVGYMGSGSPNRADALIWALAELFPAMTNAKADKPKAAAPLPIAHKWRR
ncbi:phage terminase large subunit [Thiocapsa sp. N5-Cardenillas]|uniref:phage terminase large subunit n=1 Tax=Thiocapsa sp. N5-Cardenillas TaxID=3137397 RepID=UPI0035B320D6